VVATPIGNLGDLSPRALEVLTQVDRIAAEDTRTSANLLRHFGLKRPLVAIHEHNEERRVDALVDDLRRGQTLALISDAGTPLISDPGYLLVGAARAAEIPVIAVPGPCAAIAALSIAGLPTDRFLFAGFLPHKDAARRERLRELANADCTVVLYESPHRIEACLTDLAATLVHRRVCVLRELTKQFEQSVLLPASALPEWLAMDANRARGEFVLVIEGRPAADIGATPAEALRTMTTLLQHLPPSAAARAAAELTGLPRRAMYDLALRLSAPTGADE
jgi:16S rRNA (cytidine1402-2'-O)-methyltransferase